VEGVSNCKDWRFAIGNPKGAIEAGQLVHFGKPVFGEFVEVEPIDYAIVEGRF